MATFIRPLCGLFAVATTLTLSACGGGGGSNNSGAPTPGTPTVERYALVTSFNNDTLSSYAVDADSGLMRLVDKFPSNTKATSVVLRPGHDEVLVQGSGGIYRYTLSSRGQLASESPIFAGNDMRDMVIHPSGQSLYAADFNGMGIYQFTFDENDDLIAMEPDNFVGPDYLGAGFVDLAIRSNGNQVYAADLAQDAISRFDVNAEGALTYVDSIDAGDGPWRMAQHNSTKTLYAINRHDGTLSQYRIQADGSLLSLGLADDGLGNIFEVGQLEGITLDNSGRFVYVSDRTNDKIWEFRITNDGTLEPLPGFAIGVEAEVSPGNLMASPVSDRIYLADSNAGALLAFAIGDDGTLSPMTPDRLAVDAHPTDMVFTTGKALKAHTTAAYVTNSGDDNVSQFLMADDGTLTPLGEGSEPLTGDNPGSIAIHPSHKYLYVANTGDNSVSQFRRVVSTLVDNEVDELDAIADPVAADGTPSALAVHPSGNFLYVVNKDNNNSITRFHVASNGKLNANDDEEHYQIGFTESVDLSIDPTGRFLWVVSKNSGLVLLFHIDTNDGSLTKVGDPKPAGANAQTLALTPDGQTLYTAGDDLRKFSVGDDGTLTQTLNDSGTGIGVIHLLVSPANVLYAINEVQSAIVWFSQQAGFDGLNTDSTPAGLALAPTGKHLLVALKGNQMITRFNVANDGSLTASESVAVGNLPTDVAIVGYTE